MVKAYLSFYDYVSIANCTVSKFQEKNHIVTNYIKQGLYGTYYLLNRKVRQSQNDLVTANPDLPRILQLWNILENKYLQQATEIVPLILPSIKVNKKIGIPMLDLPLMTREKIY